MKILELTHSFDGYRKSSYNQTFERYKQVFAQSEQRFRSEKDIQRLIFDFDAIYSNQAVLKLVYPLSKVDKINSFIQGRMLENYYCDKKIKSMLIFGMTHTKTFCINDNVYANNFDNKFEHFILEHLFPRKSSFEL